MYDEHSAHSAEAFLIELVQRCPFRIREIQTDNRTEFTKALVSNDPNDKSLFELKLEEYSIIYHRIRLATPRHNGKVECQHRIDQQRFYNCLRMFNLGDGRKQLGLPEGIKRRFQTLPEPPFAQSGLGGLPGGAVR